MNVAVPKKLTFSKEEEEFLQQLQIGNCKSFSTEKRTNSQTECQQWFEQKKYRITPSNPLKILIRQKNFETLIENLFVKNKKCSNITKEALNHGKEFEPIARQIYIDVMKFKLKHVSFRENGIVIQPLLYWLAASPDGLTTDESSTPILGLIEIKCPFSKRNLHPQDMLKDKNFYVELRDGMPHLKEEHSNGYYSQIQMAMGLSQLKFCDFIVYSFKGMIIIRIPFSEIYFIKLTEKLNHFFKNYALPYLIKMN